MIMERRLGVICMGMEGYILILVYMVLTILPLCQIVTTRYVYSWLRAEYFIRRDNFGAWHKNYAIRDGNFSTCHDLFTSPVLLLIFWSDGSSPKFFR